MALLTFNFLWRNCPTSVTFSRSLSLKQRAELHDIIVTPPRGFDLRDVIEDAARTWGMVATFNALKPLEN